MVHGISMDHLLRPNQKQEHNLNADILSLTGSEFRTFLFLSIIDLKVYSENVDVSQENAIELDNDAKMFSPEVTPIIIGYLL